VAIRARQRYSDDDNQCLQRFPKMASQQIQIVRGRGIPVLLDDIDTDRIIPARYLRCVSFEGLGEHAFADDRKQDPAHPFNQDRFQGANILVAGRNFGCGSSREHAPQSLMRWGIQAIVAESFAEIFFGNCTSLGIPALCASRDDLAEIATAIEASPTGEVVVDVLRKRLQCGGKDYPCTMPGGAHTALTTGAWDFLGQLLDNESRIRERATAIPYLRQFA
jgi:3-isopropylmalate/(R)-2-methylmalate dehydratase small subunit